MLLILCLLHLSIGGTAVTAQAVGPRLTSHLSDLDLDHDQLPVEMLIGLALSLSGTPPEDMGPLTTKIELLLEELALAISPDWLPYQTAENILVFLHDRVFSTYDELQTRVDIALNTGRYNCVSSAVLYLIFARSAGLSVEGVSAVDHAFCSVVLPGRTIDVETTTKHGFDPGKKREFVDDFGNTTGYSYVPPSDYSRRQTIGEKELLSLILQNRISMLERHRMFPEAVQLAVDRYVLVNDADTYGHMVREFLNFAAQLNERHDYHRAIDFLSAVVDRYGWHADYQKIYGILSYNVVVNLIQSERYDEALQRVDNYSAEGWMDSVKSGQLGTQIAERMLARDISGLPIPEALLLVRDFYSKGMLAQDRYLEYSVMLHIRHAEELAQTGDYLGATRRISASIDDLGNNSRLNEARKVYLYNYSVGIHNQFAGLFNRREYSEAKKLVVNALAHFPESSILQDDLESVSRVISSSNE